MPNPNNETGIESGLDTAQMLYRKDLDLVYDYLDETKCKGDLIFMVMKLTSDVGFNYRDELIAEAKRYKS